MEIRTYNDILHSDLDNWDTLLKQSATDVPFLKRGYLAKWRTFWGGGEWPENSQVKIFSGWENGELVGIAPTFLSKNEEEGYVLRFLGAEEISDYLDFIARPADIEPFLRAWFSFVCIDANPFIQELSLVNIPENSPSLQALASIASEFGWTTQIEKAYHTPTIPLTATWDEYLAGIDKKQRHEIRRKMRRVEESASQVSWYIVNQNHSMERELHAFFDLMALDEEKKQFLTPLMKDQMSAILSWAFEEGFLQLSFLEIEGSKSAAYCCFDYNQRIYVYNSGFDVNFSLFSPGWVLLGYLIRHAIEHQKTHFDFMRGNETYKYRFGGVDSFVMRAILKRPHN